MATNEIPAPRATRRRVDRKRLARECAKLVPKEERALAEEVFAAETFAEILDEVDETIGYSIGKY